MGGTGYFRKVGCFRSEEEEKEETRAEIAGTVEKHPEVCLVWGGFLVRSSGWAWRTSS